MATTWFSSSFGRSLLCSTGIADISTNLWMHPFRKGPRAATLTHQRAAPERLFDDTHPLESGKGSVCRNGATGPVALPKRSSPERQRTPGDCVYESGQLGPRANYSRICLRARGNFGETCPIFFSVVNPSGR